MGIVERLRNAATEEHFFECECFPFFLGKTCQDFDSCRDCAIAVFNDIADAIEAEQAERHHDVDADVDVDTLLKVANSIEYEAQRKTGVSIIPATQLSLWVGYIRDAVKGATFEQAKPQLPDGIEWPRFEDGELVKFGDAVDTDGPTINHVSTITIYENGRFRMHGTSANSTSDESIGEWCFRYGEPVKRPEPEVLDADGVPIKVGDIVYGTGREEHRYSVVNPAHPEGEGRFMVKCEDLNECEFCFCDPSMLTHHAPVRDADGVPIKVGDTVYWTKGGNAKTVKRIVDGFVEIEDSIARIFPEQLTHRKPDTLEDVVSEMIADWYGDEAIDLPDYFDRLRKLLGGE